MAAVRYVHGSSKEDMVGKKGVRIQVTIEDIYCCLGCLAAVVIEEREYLYTSPLFYISTSS